MFHLVLTAALCSLILLGEVGRLSLCSRNAVNRPTDHSLGTLGEKISVANAIKLDA